MYKKNNLSKFEEAIEDIKIIIRARYPILYIISDEKEHEIIKILYSMCKEGTYGKKYQKDMYMWDISRGITMPNIDGKNIYSKTISEESKDPLLAFDWIQENNKDKDSIYIFSEFHHYLEEPSIQRKLRLFSEITANNERKMIILLSTKNDGMSGNGKIISTELENIVNIYDWPYPDEKHIIKFLSKDIIPSLNLSLEDAGIKKMSFDKDKMKEIVNACKGMTLSQIDHATSKSIIIHKTLLPKTIAIEKKQIIKKSDLCDYIEPNESLEDIGGLANLKRWLKSRKNILSEEAFDFGCNVPNGVLFIGPWGSGKSSAAKAIINDWQIPGLRIDASKIYDMYVGSSERKINAILKLAESISPCIVGETEILMSNGNKIKIEDIFNNAKDFKKTKNIEIKTLKNLFLTSLNDELKPIEVRGKYITKRKTNSFLEIITKQNRIECTENHLIPILNENAEISWRQSSKLSVGDYVVTKNVLLNKKIFNKNDFIYPKVIYDEEDSVYIPEMVFNIKKSIKDDVNKISKKIGGNLSEYQNGTRAIPRRRLEELINVYESEISEECLGKIKIIINKDISFEKIKSIKKINKEEYVYDIVCEKDKNISQRNFLANNILIHNCILWFDEIENLFAGSESSVSDGGTSSRVLGIISTWMSEHEGTVFNIFTANDISNSPSKLFRKGRLDEIFIIDLPVEEERKEIFYIHIKKRLERQGKIDIIDNININLLSKESINFSGAEIEAAVNSAFILAYNDDKRNIKTEDIQKSCKETIPLSCTKREEIKRMREWQKGRAVSASDYICEEIQDIKEFYNLGQKNLDI